MFHWTKTAIKMVPRIVVNYFAWMIKYSRGRGQKYPFSMRYNKLRKLLVRLTDAFDADITIEGKENIPEGAAALFPNHLSGFDPLLLITTLDTPTSFVAKKEIRKWIIVNRCFDAIDGVYIDREDLKQSLRTMMKVEKDLIEKRDKKWIIFPEGTRNKDTMNNLREFHHGSFRAAVKAKVPIVPIAMCGQQRIFKFVPQYKKYPVHIKYLKPLMPEEYEHMTTQEVAQYVQNEVDKALNYDLRLRNHKAMVKYKNYRFNKL
ncbi:MAG: 1-acyl-sn-glycerol-3-phosphate acyltransferase [Bacilli bacterium]|nr:1-acyl-sn-glycerol-3-phosphate acyltransferase [Bacilli bacterium]